jgi:hypothetical protein
MGQHASSCREWARLPPRSSENEYFKLCMKLYALLPFGLLLAACTDPVPTPVVPALTYSLTVTVNGVVSAPVTVTNTTTNKVEFTGALGGSKIFAALPKDTVLKVEGATVNSFVSPAPQTIQLDEDKTVILSYSPVPSAKIPTGDIRLSQGVGQYIFPDQDAAGQKLDLIGRRVENQVVKYTLLAQTTVAPDLSFTFPEVDAAKLSLSPLLQRLGDVAALPASCKGTSIMSDPEVRLLLETETEIDGNTISGHINLAVMTLDQPDRPLQFVYADRAGTLKTDVVCTDQISETQSFTYRALFDLDFKKGWNLIEDIEPYQQVNPTAIKRSVARPSTVRLRPSGNYAVGGSWGGSAPPMDVLKTNPKGMFF